MRTGQQLSNGDSAIERGTHLKWKSNIMMAENKHPHLTSGNWKNMP